MRFVRRGLRRAPKLLWVALLISLVGVDATPAAAATCAGLAGLALPDTTITAAEPVQPVPTPHPTARSSPIFRLFVGSRRL